MGTGKGTLSQQELTLMWMAAASLERVHVKSKRDLGAALLTALESGEEVTPQALWGLGRLGAHRRPGLQCGFGG